MKAIVCAGREAPGRLALRDVAKPVPGKREMLIRVRAATVTPSDVSGMGLVRMSKPFRRFSKRPDAIPGVEFAGVVEAAGSRVTGYKPGDRVFGSAGTAFGAWAEYLCVSGDGVLAPIPSAMSFSQAAGICDGALTALRFLRDKAGVSAGQDVLVIGASGGVGSYAVQLARYFGCDVTGVCSAGSAGLVKSLGAVRVIDYAAEDFTRTAWRYDVIFDVAGKSSFKRCKNILKPRGIYLTTIPSPAIMLQMLLTRSGSGKKALFAATGLAKRGVKIQALGLLRELAEAGKLISVKDRQYPFAKIQEAVRYVGLGHKRGNVIIVPEPAVGAP